MSTCIKSYHAVAKPNADATMLTCKTVILHVNMQKSVVGFWSADVFCSTDMEDEMDAVGVWSADMQDDDQQAEKQIIWTEEDQQKISKLQGEAGL